MEMGNSYCLREMLPFVVLILLQSVLVGLSTLFKAAATKGMSYSVFIVYSYALSGLVLLPFALIFDRKKKLPPFNFSIFWRICLLGFFGFTSQMCGFKGIEYSSPTLASAISCLSPAFTFALAIFFRMEKLEPKRLSSQAKIAGTMISVAGALVVVLYKGPIVVQSSSSPSELLDTPSLSILLYNPLASSQSNWIIGGVLLTLDYFILSTWYIFQVQTIKIYPAENLVVALYDLCVAIMTAPIAYMLEPDSSAWTISSGMMLIAILYSGLFATSFATVLLTWALRVKGPVYAALFTPSSVVIAAILGIMFLGDSLYLGCIGGAIIICLGFYVVMWGKSKEKMGKDIEVISLESGCTAYVPLLQ